MVKPIKRQTVENLSINEWGKARLEKVEKPDGLSYIRIEHLYRSFLADEVLLYNNDDLLLRVSCNEENRRGGFILLTPWTSSGIYAEISETIYDDKYRKVVELDDNGKRKVSLLNEKTGILQFGWTKWNDILDVHDGIAVISFVPQGENRVRQALVRFSSSLSGNELIASEITHIKGPLYKYRIDSALYYLYNTNNRLSSKHGVGYTDIEYISNQLAMGVIYNEQWNFIRTAPSITSNELPIVCTSYVKPIFDNDVINIVDLNENDEEMELQINYSGTKLSKEYAEKTDEDSKEMITNSNSYKGIDDEKDVTKDDDIVNMHKMIMNTSVDNKIDTIQGRFNNTCVDYPFDESNDDTHRKDMLKLKTIYFFLKQQDFDFNTIYKVIDILFPSIEKSYDLTNVKKKNAVLCKKIEEHSLICNQIKSDTNYLLELLNLNEKELVILNYYTKVKKLSIPEAIEYVNKESDTGYRVQIKYNELMRLDTVLDEECKELRKLIVEDIVRHGVNLEKTTDTKVAIPTNKTSSQMPEDSPKGGRVNNFEGSDGKTYIKIFIKKKEHKLCIDDIIKYDLFENKKVCNFRHDIHYVQLGKDILVFISKRKAEEIRKEQSQYIILRGNGEDKRFSQEFTHINALIKKQAENESRIFLFEYNDESTCKFYDELSYVSFDLIKEEDRDVIMFKLKSLYRFNMGKI